MAGDIEEIFPQAEVIEMPPHYASMLEDLPRPENFPPDGTRNELFSRHKLIALALGGQTVVRLISVSPCFSGCLILRSGHAGSICDVSSIVLFARNGLN
jgi:hypothetical protein